MGQACGDRSLKTQTLLRIGDIGMARPNLQTVITLQDMKKGEFEVLAQVLSLDLCQQCGSNAGVAS